MNHKKAEYIIIDAETIPDENAKAPVFDPSSVRVGNIKDPKKIEEKIAQANEDYSKGLTKKMSISSNLCRMISLGIIILNQIGRAHV